MLTEALASWNRMCAYVWVHVAYMYISMYVRMYKNRCVRVHLFIGGNISVSVREPGSAERAPRLFAKLLCEAGSEVASCPLRAPTNEAAREIV